MEKPAITAVSDTDVITTTADKHDAKPSDTRKEVNTSGERVAPSDRELLKTSRTSVVSCDDSAVLAESSSDSSQSVLVSSTSISPVVLAPKSTTATGLQSDDVSQLSRLYATDSIMQLDSSDPEPVYDRATPSLQSPRYLSSSTNGDTVDSGGDASKSGDGSNVVLLFGKVAVKRPDAASMPFPMASPPIPKQSARAITRRRKSSSTLTSSATQSPLRRSGEFLTDTHSVGGESPSIPMLAVSAPATSPKLQDVGRSIGSRSSSSTTTRTLVRSSADSTFARQTFVGRNALALFMEPGTGETIAIRYKSMRFTCFMGSSSIVEPVEIAVDDIICVGRYIYAVETIDHAEKANAARIRLQRFVKYTDDSGKYLVRSNEYFRVDQTHISSMNHYDCTKDNFSIAEAWFAKLCVEKSQKKTAALTAVSLPKKTCSQPHPDKDFVIRFDTRDIDTTKVPSGYTFSYERTGVAIRCDIVKHSSAQPTVLSSASPESPPRNLMCCDDIDSSRSQPSAKRDSATMLSGCSPQHIDSSPPPSSKKSRSRRAKCLDSQSALSASLSPPLHLSTRSDSVATSSPAVPVSPDISKFCSVATESVSACGINSKDAGFGIIASIPVSCRVSGVDCSQQRATLDRFASSPQRVEHQEKIKGMSPVANKSFDSVSFETFA